MFLRRCVRRKNGKQHTYWPLVESYRTARVSRQRVVAYLGELNPTEEDACHECMWMTKADKQCRCMAIDKRRKTTWNIVVIWTTSSNPSGRGHASSDSNATGLGPTHHHRRSTQMRTINPRSRRIRGYQTTNLQSDGWCSLSRSWHRPDIHVQCSGHILRRRCTCHLSRRQYGAAV
jgi:hypothetical protein